MKRLLCLIVTIGCLAGLLAGCDDVPAAQNSILSSSRTASSAWASGEEEESDLSDPEQPIQEDSNINFRARSVVGGVFMKSLDHYLRNKRK